MWHNYFVVSDIDRSRLFQSVTALNNRQPFGCIFANFCAPVSDCWQRSAAIKPSPSWRSPYTTDSQTLEIITSMIKVDHTWKQPFQYGLHEPSKNMLGNFRSRTCWIAHRGVRHGVC